MLTEDEGAEVFAPGMKPGLMWGPPEQWAMPPDLQLHHLPFNEARQVNDRLAHYIGQAGPSRGPSALHSDTIVSVVFGFKLIPQ